MGGCMKSLFQGEPSKATIAVMPRRWWTGAARILGFSSAAHTVETGSGFDFAALQRSLEGAGYKRPKEE